jgi:hypothetical protein
MEEIEIDGNVIQLQTNTIYYKLVHPVYNILINYLLIFSFNSIFICFLYFRNPLTFAT